MRCSRVRGSEIILGESDESDEVFEVLGLEIGSGRGVETFRAAGSPSLVGTSIGVDKSPWKRLSS